VARGCETKSKAVKKAIAVLCLEMGFSFTAGEVKISTVSHQTRHALIR